MEMEARAKFKTIPLQRLAQELEIAVDEKKHVLIADRNGNCQVYFHHKAT
jgi:hypothetical protein